MLVLLDVRVCVCVCIVGQDIPWSSTPRDCARRKYLPARCSPSRGKSQRGRAELFSRRHSTSPVKLLLELGVAWSTPGSPIPFPHESLKQ